jgi:YD repeat-containing protein
MVTRTSTYDAENRQVTVTNAQSVTATYAYDGDGRRVKKTVNGNTTTFVYDAAGQLAAEYGGPAPVESGTRYLFGDHLGSTRLVARADGTVDKTYDYLPFGEELGGFYPGDADTRGRQAMKFTGKERDAETGLDYFGARYMSAAQGFAESADEHVARRGV